MASNRKGHDPSLLMPELVEPVAGPWTIHETDIREAAVDTETREAWVPVARTQAQRLARLHELGHVKYSPSPHQEQGDWHAVFSKVMALCEARSGINADYAAVVHISKMLEENRIDWLLWDTHGIDLRPAREVFEWSAMSDPDDALDALGWCLQLAWTVWGSRGLGKGVPNLPPARQPDIDTGLYFDKSWKLLLDTRREIALTMVRGCMQMYHSPTPERRDEVAADLASFFPAEKREEQKMPPTRKEEAEADREERRREHEHKAYRDEQETGVGGDVVTDGHVQYHDHTSNIRRPSMRIARRRVPVSQGVDLRHPHRYMMDKAVFSQRLLTDGSLMVDGSGSMRWSNEDMQHLMEALPAIRVGVYSGFDGQPGVYGRICTVARNGRFARYEGLDPGHNDGNEVDYEALQLLATWPKPRFWLSDGQVCGGAYSSRSAEHHEATGWYVSYGLLHEMCNEIMKRYDILRIPDRETMHKLLDRKRVTLYRSTRCADDDPYSSDAYWPASVKPEPIQFTL